MERSILDATVPSSRVMSSFLPGSVDFKLFHIVGAAGWGHSQDECLVTVCRSRNVKQTTRHAEHTATTCRTQPRHRQSTREHMQSTLAGTRNGQHTQSTQPAHRQHTPSMQNTPRQSTREHMQSTLAGTRNGQHTQSTPPAQTKRTARTRQARHQHMSARTDRVQSVVKTFWEKLLVW